MLSYTICHDITAILGVETPTYPGDTAFARTAPHAGPDADLETTEANQLLMGTHNGTHLDSPAHFFPRSKHLDDYPASHFIRPARVVDIVNPEAVQVTELVDITLETGEAILFRTRNSREGLVTNSVFTEAFVPLARDAAQWCVDQGVPLVGHDYITVDPYGDREAPAHNLLLGNGITILEGINLHRVLSGQYLLVCLPLSMKHAEGSPCRAVLLQ